MSKRACIAAILVGATGFAWTSARADAVIDWNGVTMNCVQGQGAAIPANRGGPVGLLDIALVQLAVHDAVQAIQGRFAAYEYDNDALQGVGDPEAAAAAAAFGTLVGLYGADDACLAAVEDPADTYAGDPGLQAGDEAAAALLPMYRPFFVLPTDPYLGGDEPGQWRPTPGSTMGINTWMAETAPFVLESPDQFLPKPQPGLTSDAYTRDFNEVKAYGSKTSTDRTPEQTDLANFWTANPIHLWFATVRSIASAKLTDPGDSARLLALVATAAADGQIAVYDSKYHFEFWRPTTAIRFADTDGNDSTDVDIAWEPYIVDPAYPDYVSGANSLATTITKTMELFFGSNRMEFSMTSPIAGLTTNPRIYKSFSTAAEDVVDVRVWQGIHFRFADRAGRRQGKHVAQWVFENALQPLP